MTDSKQIGNNENKKLLEAMLNSSLDSFFVVDAETRKFVFANQSACENLGYTREELLKLGPKDVQIKYPVDTLWDDLVKKARKGLFWAEGTHRKKGGNTFPVRVRINLGMFNGREYLLAVATDISSEQIQKSRYRALINAIPDLIFLLDKEGRYLDFFPAKGFESMFPPENFLGKKLVTVFPHNIADIYNRFLRKAMETKTTQEFKYELVGGGKTKYFEARLVPLIDGTVLTLVRDLTEGKILKEKVAKLSKKVPLTKKEQAVFFGLVKYPGETDQSIAGKLGLSRSTVTAIKNKLLREKFFSIYAIPNFYLLGCELLAVAHGVKQTANCVASEFQESHPELVYIQSAKNECICVLVSRNYTEMRFIIDNIFKNKCYIKNAEINYFPFEMNKVFKFFDYGGVVKKILEVEDNIEENCEFKAKPRRNLSPAEKKVLYSICKFPNLTDSELAEKVGIPRQKFSRIKKTLVNSDFIRMANIPNIKKINCRVLSYVKARTSMNGSNYKEINSTLMFLQAANPYELTALCLHTDFSDYKTFCDNLKNKSFIVGEPVFNLFPVDQIIENRVSFAPLVRKIFNLDVNL